MRDQLEINVRRQLAPRPRTDLNVAKSPRGHLPKGCVGIASAMELAIRFIDWADSQPVLTYSGIMDEFHVCKATAYRWLASYHHARGHYHKGTR
jgi:hypothetical protein